MDGTLADVVAADGAGVDAAGGGTAIDVCGIEDGVTGGLYCPVDTEFLDGVVADSRSVSVVSNATPSVDTSVIPKMAHPIQQRMVPA